MNKDLENENKLLSFQLSQMQETLQLYYLECKRLLGEHGIPCELSSEPDDDGSNIFGSSVLLGRLTSSNSEQPEKFNIDEVLQDSPIYRSIVSELSSVKSANKELTEREASLAAELAAAREKVEQLESQLDITLKKLELQETLSLKASRKAEADLEDLRQQIGTSRESERSLVDLVNELREKLLSASSFYARLAAEHPELLANEHN